VLLRAAPDELAHAAPELLRALLFCRVPEWAEAEAGRPEDRPEAQRLRGLCALLAAQPASAGGAALAEVYSPHLDQYQRLLLLDGLCLAAHELCSPLSAPRLEQGVGAPRVVAGGGGGGGGKEPAALAGGRGGEGGAGGAALDGGGRGRVVAPGMREAGSRVWGRAALARRGAPAPPVFLNRWAGGQGRAGACLAPLAPLPWSLSSRAHCNGMFPARLPPPLVASSPGVRWNCPPLAPCPRPPHLPLLPPAPPHPPTHTPPRRFADVALPWTLGLLRECDVRKHGLDLFGRCARTGCRCLPSVCARPLPPHSPSYTHPTPQGLGAPGPPADHAGHLRRGRRAVARRRACGGRAAGAAAGAGGALPRRALRQEVRRGGRRGGSLGGLLGEGGGWARSLEGRARMGARACGGRRLGAGC
jgi:hypothetical protein